ncbi:MarR family winged helix-turn-helix transcriptional regulator [Vibrio panuliri]|uniref:MarR family transcriptional regulator n=1 Tax=Vibrio panuliri TaxID=1381081 RepID=A0ABX3FRV2_9VIBR|nr:MarR family transcriptional regulator [Vibrio panuliri]KAB1460107.1 MarR family transcriptional regulator [Vibrio panuliri]OLQ96510.1 MarR family transcriptional regulator [Vibrio panuliri]
MHLEESLMDLERFCSKAWRQHGNDDPMCQLSFNEFDYLKVIEQYPEGVRITDLAQELYVTKPSASTMVSRLAKKNLVRTIACREDARAKRVVLTDWVIKNMSFERVVYQQIASDLNAQLSEEEAMKLVELLNKALKK